jgi:hypothetical protein
LADLQHHPAARLKATPPFGRIAGWSMSHGDATLLVTENLADRPSGDILRGVELLALLVVSPPKGNEAKRWPQFVEITSALEATMRSTVSAVGQPLKAANVTEARPVTQSRHPFGISSTAVGQE